VSNMTAGRTGADIYHYHLAHALKMNVVAKGVETEEQSRLLRLLGCDEMQGFLLSKAVPGDIFETEFLRHFEKATSYIASGASSDVVHSR
jgi:sensor c-di-GMP phosphodiesterase-like protein